MIEDLIHQATEHGNSIGQTALAEFILKSYGHELSPKLTQFLEKVSQNEYDKIAKTLDKPAEDIALEVGKIMERVN